MRYDSTSDSQLLRKSSMGPVLASARRRYDLAVPGRGIAGYGSRQTLRGFGATNFGPPIGAGAGRGATIGASQGASIGSAIVPGVGTAIGAAIGAIGGAIAGSINKVDPETYNFDQAVSIWQQNPDAVYSIGNKYLPLAGVFDNYKNVGGIPIIHKYGRMGEEPFTRDMAMLIYHAGQAGQITSQDTVLSVMSRIVQPWINSWGYGPMNDPHGDLINRLLVGMVMDYLTGAAPNVWRSRSGPLPASFSQIPPFSLPQAAPPPVPTPAPAPAPAPVQAPTASPTPSPQPVTYPVAAPPSSGFYPGGNVVAPPVPAAPVISTTPPALNAPMQYAMDSATGKMVALPPGATFGGGLPPIDFGYPRWLVVYPSGPNAGTYILSNGALTPYTATTGRQVQILPATSPTTLPAAPQTTPSVTGQTLSPPPGYTKTTQSAVVAGTTFPLYADTQGNLYLWSGGQMLLYQSTASATAPPATTTSVSSGGGGFYPGWSEPTSSSGTSAAVSPVAPVSGIDMNTMMLLGGSALVLYLLAK